MQLTLMRGLKLGAASAAVLVVIAIGRIWWASLPPKLPKGWPPGSIWVQEPGVRLSLVPRGAWEGCWLDAQHGVDQCKFADYKGKIFYEDEYETCTEQPPIADEGLRLKPSTTTAIYLKNGTVLLEVSLCEAHNQSIAKPSPPK